MFNYGMLTQVQLEMLYNTGHVMWHNYNQLNLPTFLSKIRRILNYQTFLTQTVAD